MNDRDALRLSIQITSGLALAMDDATRRQGIGDPARSKIQRRIVRTLRAVRIDTRRLLAWLEGRDE